MLIEQYIYSKLGKELGSRINELSFYTRLDQITVGDQSATIPNFCSRNASIGKVRDRLKSSMAIIY